MTDEQGSAPAPPRRKRHLLGITIGIIVVGLAFLLGALPRLRARQQVRTETAEMAIPQVSVIYPERSAPAQRLLLPGSVQAYASAPIFARASGYVKAWHADIGAQVKAGQLLAEIEVPEVDQQLEQARSALDAAKANLRTSEATAKRFEGLAQTRAVSKLEVDNAVGAFQANQATVQAAEANVRQLEKVLSYAHVRAPFDGVITMRNVDVGDLINAGSSTPSSALFQISQSDKLRVYVSVPEAYAQSVKPGLVAVLTLAALPGRQFAGKLVRTANAIDPATRTLLVEIQVDNPNGELFAGAFSEVHLDIPRAAPVFTVPVETLLFRHEGLQLATVANGRVTLKTVTPGRDFGTTIEIVHGLTGGEAVVVSPPDSIETGDLVRAFAKTRAARR
jgi:RND family efflux transporter MFP subunit